MKTISTVFLIFQLLFCNSLIAQNCKRPAAKKDLDINMVRATMLTGGDMWWDRIGNAKYEVPKGSKRNAIFAGAIWMGALDAGNNLKLAAQTYHQTGDDFWPGPKDSMDRAQCTSYDRIWSIKRSEFEAFRNGAAPTKDIQEWPGINLGAKKAGKRALAPFKDVNSDGKYVVTDGDYPLFALNGGGPINCDEALTGDQVLWWVLNDIGNIHTETQGDALGVEIQVTAYAFERLPSTKDSALLYTTFYRYRITNTSTEIRRNSYFGIWADVDLGNPVDDAVGCDVMRGMGYSYNGDNVDEDAAAFGYSSLDPKSPPPAVGLDILRGPLADVGDGIDNDRDSSIDEAGETIDLSNFVFMENGGPTSIAADYYKYIRTYWRDGKHGVYGGTGYPGSSGSTNIDCNYMFPGDSDPFYYATNGVAVPPWYDTNVGDRQFVTSNGPFTLNPGQTAIVHTAVIYARARVGNNLASINVLQKASDVIQTLFDNCFSALYSSLPTIATEAKILLYPNPATDEINVQGLKRNAELLLYNLQGQVVTKRPVKKTDTSINVSELPRGLYLYNIQLTNEKKQSGKIMLN